MMKKYELLDECCANVNGKILHRIVAVRDFGDIKKGTIGGYIEKEYNLSHSGDCWIEDDAMVFGNAIVRNNARVTDFAKVYGNSMISDNARIVDNAHINGCAHINDNAVVTNYAKVGEHSIINDNVFIGGTAEILGYCRLNGNIHISNMAYITNNNDIITIGPVLFGKHVYFYKSRVKSGIEVVDTTLSFSGDIDKYVKHIKLKSLGMAQRYLIKRYLIMCKFVKLWFKLK